jgi:hypothetical protein
MTQAHKVSFRALFAASRRHLSGNFSTYSVNRDKKKAGACKPGPVSNRMCYSFEPDSR